MVVVTINTENESLGKKDLFISMPQITKLTLARNEVSFKERNCFEERYIKKVISKTLEHILLEKGMDEEHLLSILYQGLKKWEEKSMADIRGIFTSYFKEEFKRILEENSNIIPVPTRYHENFLCMLEENNDKTFISIDDDLIDFNYVSLEGFLTYPLHNNIEKEGKISHKNIMRDALEGNLFPGIYMSFIDDDCFYLSSEKQASFVSSFGLKSHLFAPKSLFEKTNGRKGENEIKHSLATQLSDLATEYDIAQNNSEVMQPPVITNFSKFKDNTYYDYNWISEPKNDAFFTAHKQFSVFSGKDREVLEKFFIKYRDILLEKHLLAFIYPKRLDAFAGENHTEFSFSEKFKRYITKNLLVSSGWESRHRRDLYYFFYNEKEKNFFVSSLPLDNILSLGYNTTYVPYLEYGEGDYWLATEYIIPHDGKKKTLWQCTQKDGDEKCIVDKFAQWAYKNRLSEVGQAPLKYEWNNPKHGQDLYFYNTEDAINKALESLETPEDIETYETVMAGIRENLVSSGKILQMHDFMNNLFGALLLPFGKEQLFDNNKIIFVDGKQVWPIQEELSLEKLEDLFFSLFAFFLEKEDNLSHTKIEQIYAANKKWKSPVFFRPELNSNEIYAFNEWFKKFGGWIASRENTLENALPGLDLFGSIFDQIQWVTRNIEKNKLSKKTTHLIKQMQDTTFSLYNKYFNIPDSSFHRDYGEKKPKINVRNPNHDMENVDSVYNLIDAMQKTPSLLRKLIDFQTDDFKFQTDTLARDKDLESRVFYNPSTLSNTPISVLTLLREWDVDHKIITAIVDETRTPDELMFIAYTILSDEIREYFDPEYTKPEKIEEMAHSIRLIIKHVLRERIGANRLFDIYNKNRREENTSYRKGNVNREPQVKTIIAFLKTIYEQTLFVEKRETLSDISINDDLQKSQFRLSQLLKAHMDGSGLAHDLRSYNLRSLITKIKKQTEDLGLGKIPQSIEDNDEKNPLLSPITETTQNSADAIVDFMTKREASDYVIDASLSLRKNEGNADEMSNLTKIKYKLEWMDDIDHKDDLTHTCLTAHDFIGFPNIKTLLTDFLLPDYNNKGNGSIGEMGNGALKMYRNARKVLVMTRIVEDPSKVYLLIITPIKDRLTESVNDLDIICLDVSEKAPKNFFGTSIRILFNSKPSKETKMDLLLLTNFFKTFISTFKIDLPSTGDISIYLNNELLNDEQSYQVFTEKVNNETGKYEFRLRKLDKEFMPSQVTTGGIPFSSMDSFLKNYNLLPPSLLNMLSLGFILDIGKDVYDPVVSRNLLQITPEKLKELKTFLLDSCYKYGLNIGSKNYNFLASNFLHFGSRSSLFCQVTLSKKDNRYFQEMIKRFLNNEKVSIKKGDFFTYYKPTLLEKGFFDLIEDGYKKMVPKIEGIKKALQASSDDELEKLEEELIKKASAEDDKEKREALVKEGKKKYDEIFTKYRIQFREKEALERKLWKDSFAKDPYDLKNRVVVPWFDKKSPCFIERRFNKKDDQRVMSEKQKEKKIEMEDEWDELFNEKQLEQIRSIKGLIEDMFYHYGKILLEKVGANEKNLRRMKVIYSKESKTAAMYNGSDVYINLAKLISPQDILESLRYFLQKENERISPASLKAFKKTFIPSLNFTPTFIHELEHVRRRDSSDNSVHNKCTLKDGKKVTFDICANEYAREAKNKGLIIDWRKKMESSLENKNIAQTLDKLIAFVKQGPKEERFAIKILGIEDKRI